MTRWWESPTGPLRAEGESLYEPAKGCRIMQVDGAALDAELARRADKHGQPVGIEITEHVGVAGLEAARLLVLGRGGFRERCVGSHFYGACETSGVARELVRSGARVNGGFASMAC